MTLPNAKVLRPFNYSDDGIHVRQVVPGEVIGALPHLLPGLLADGFVEVTDEPVSTAERLVELRAAPEAFDYRLAAGIDPPVSGQGWATENTRVKPEHVEPLIAAAREDPAAAAAVGAGAVRDPANPPPVEDRRTPPHPLGTVVDPDDRAARDAAVASAEQGLPLTEPRAAEAEEAAEATGKPVEEVVAGAPAEGEQTPENADQEKAEPAADVEEEADAAGEYDTKDEKPGRRGRKGR